MKKKDNVLREEVLELSGISVLSEGKTVNTKIAGDIKKVAEREKKGGGKVVFDKAGGISVKLANGESWYFQPGDDADKVSKDIPNNVNREDYIFWAAQGW